MSSLFKGFEVISFSFYNLTRIDMQSAVDLPPCLGFYRQIIDHRDNIIIFREMYNVEDNHVKPRVRSCGTGKND